MSLILIGTSYKYSGLEAREKFYFSKNDITAALSGLLEKEIARGVVILSTCQRTEIYAELETAQLLKNFLLNFRKEIQGLEGNFYIKKDIDAIEHLFSVAAGLDSQIVGENEILHQVKEAYFQAREFEATTPFLNRLFERALFAGKLIRQKTDILCRDSSLASAAVNKAQELSGDFHQKKIYIIGAGAISQKVAQLVSEKGAQCIIVANRTFERAKDLAGQVEGRAARFEDFYKLLNEADILFSATASRHLILKKETFRKNRQPAKPLIIFDLAFPRDIDPDISEFSGVTLFNLDEFKDEQLSRQQEIDEAKELVKEKALRFFKKEEEDPWKLESVSAPAPWH